MHQVNKSIIAIARCANASLMLVILAQFVAPVPSLWASESWIPEQDLAAVEALRLRHAQVPAWGYEVTWVSPRWAQGQGPEAVRVGAIIESIDGQPAAWVDTYRRYFDGFTDARIAVFRQPDGSRITVNQLPLFGQMSIRRGMWYQGVLH